MLIQILRSIYEENGIFYSNLLKFNLGSHLLTKYKNINNTILWLHYIKNKCIPQHTGTKWKKVWASQNHKVYHKDR